MKTIPCVQGSPDWLAARCGKVTASRLADVLAKIKSGEAAGRRNYRAQLVVEILTGESQDGDGYLSQDMKNGTEQEPFARAAYECERNVMVDQIGFAVHSAIPRFGASPDGLVGDDGMIELKCVKPATQLAYILSGICPSEYRLQVQGGIDCCERQWCDFVSYSAVMPPHLRLFIVRVPRDQLLILEMQTEVEKFLAEVDDVLARLPRAGSDEPVLTQQMRDSLIAAQARNLHKVLPKIGGAAMTGECAAPAKESPSTVCSEVPSRTNQPELEAEPF